MARSRVVGARLEGREARRGQRACDHRGPQALSRLGLAQGTGRLPEPRGEHGELPAPRQRVRGLEAPMLPLLAGRGSEHLWW